MDSKSDGAKELAAAKPVLCVLREVQLSDKDEAVGAQGVPLTPGRSIAVDKALHVYGTPFFIEGELPIESEQSKTPFRRLTVAQDTARRSRARRAPISISAPAPMPDGCWPPPAHMRFVILIPKSSIQRREAQDAVAGCKALGEDRQAVSTN